MIELGCSEPGMKNEEYYREKQEQSGGGEHTIGDSACLPGTGFGIITRLALLLFEVHQKQQNSGNVVGSDHLDQEGHTPTNASHEQPSRLADFEVSQQSCCSKRGKEQVVPGRHGGGIIGIAPRHGYQRDQARGNGGGKTQPDIVNGWNPCQKKQEGAYSQRH